MPYVVLLMLLLALPSYGDEVFEVTGEEGLSVERLTGIRSQHPFYSLRVNHHGPGSIAFQTTESDTLKVRATTGQASVPATIKGLYEHVDIDIQLPSPDAFVTAEVYIPQTMVFEEMQITTQDASIEVSGRFEASRPKHRFNLRSGHGAIRAHHLHYPGRLDVLSLLGAVELSDAIVQSAVVKSFGKQTVKADNVESESLDLMTDNGTLLLCGKQNKVCMQIKKAGRVHVVGASVASKLMTSAMLSQAGSSHLTVERSFLPKGMSLQWQVVGDDFPSNETKVMQVEGLDVTYGDLLTYGGLFDLERHLKARGADDICQRLFYCPPVSWGL